MVDGGEHSLDQLVYYVEEPERIYEVDYYILFQGEALIVNEMGRGKFLL